MIYLRLFQLADAREIPAQDPEYHLAFYRSSHGPPHMVIPALEPLHERVIALRGTSSCATLYPVLP
jgi:hypothetical protein